MKKALFIVLALASLSPPVLGQDESQGRSDRVESLRIAFITEKLSLSSKEAAVFWPVFNEFNDQMKKIHAKQKENVLVFRAKASPTSEESDKFINEHLSFKQAELDLTKRYVTEFKKVLTDAKVARLLTLEQEFKRQLLQRFRNREDHMQRP